MTTLVWYATRQINHMDMEELFTQTLDGFSMDSSNKVWSMAILEILIKLVGTIKENIKMVLHIDFFENIDRI